MENTLEVLVVDDDEVDRMLLIRSLKAAGLNIHLTEVTNFDEVIVTLAETKFDCIFIDDCLPGKDGLTLIKEIRGLNITSPLIVLTGQGDEQIAVDIMKAGAYDYIPKSKITPDRLGLVTRNAIKFYQANTEATLANQRLQESYDLLVKQNHQLEAQQRQIQLQNWQLKKASQLKSQFLSMMSHELKTPLNAIIGFSQMLLRPSKGILNQQQSKMVETILRNGKQLLTMLNEILDLSEIEAGNAKLKPDFFDLTQVINNVVEEIYPQAIAKNINLFTDIHLKNSKVFNDSRRLRQVLIHLLSNAIKFTDSGGKVWVEVSAIQPDIHSEIKLDREMNKLIISVHDTGIGIALEDLEYIFEPFRQIDQTITKKYPGTGVGLAITDSIIKMMSGKITVSSEIGQCTTFQIEIPRNIPLTVDC
ncbi:MAG: response regulator [Scytonematopsis contorta HA4267-MV1]|jgi:signal transduction histidine kinase|nr:response regulator [Scytonematopsis contorta HA4267-MV1]